MSNKDSDVKRNKPNVRWVWTIIILVVSIALIVVGVLNNQVNDVLAKATRVCLECIGIG